MKRYLLPLVFLLAACGREPAPHSQPAVTPPQATIMCDADRWHLELNAAAEPATFDLYVNGYRYETNGLVLAPIDVEAGTTQDVWVPVTSGSTVLVASSPSGAGLSLEAPACLGLEPAWEVHDL